MGITWKTFTGSLAKNACLISNCSTRICFRVTKESVCWALFFGFVKDLQRELVRLLNLQYLNCAVAQLLTRPCQTRNPAHRRPWLKMKIEYHPALIFCAFVRGFLKFQVYTLFVAEFHWKVSYMAFSPQRNDNFNAFLKWRNYFVYARICFFFSSSDSINPAAGGLPSVPKIRSSVASTYVGKVHER